ncbi:hypothetical protein [Emticicia soli]|uniref:Anti-sigma factor n=1 Tax=Emticicia soli TaxID=2027878 RepID=A0ABW5J4K5_9BACT
MKKHPIDELFANKLAEHRQEPSQKAFEKFQARLQEKETKRRGGVFAISRNWSYYAAAAGVVAVLTVGILSQRNTNDTQFVADSSKPKVETQNQIDSAINKDKPALLAKTDGEKVNSLTERTQPKSVNNIIASTKKVEMDATKAPVTKETITPIQQAPLDAIALNQPEAVSTSPIEVLTGKNASTIETFSKENTALATKHNVGEVVLVITPLEVEKGASQSIAKTEKSIAENEEKERSFLAKLYGEYKHFKYGEKVDLKRLGVKDVVARVDEGLLKEERDDVRDFVQRRISRMQKRE